MAGGLLWTHHPFGAKWTVGGIVRREVSGSQKDRVNPLKPCDGVLFQVGQDEESFVCHRRQGTVVIRTVSATRARLPINHTVMHGGHKRLLKIG